MIESAANIASATNEQLDAALNKIAGAHPLYYKLLTEQARRSTERENQRIAEEIARPFNPRVDVSADAKYLWKRIFIWFWVVPLVGIIVAISRA